MRTSALNGGQDAIVAYGEDGLERKGEAIKINMGDEVPESVYILGNAPQSGKEIVKDIEHMSIAGIIMIDGDYRIDKTDINKLKKYSKKDLAYHIVKLSSGNNILLVTPYQITHTIVLEGGDKMQVFTTGVWNIMEAPKYALIIIDGETYTGKMSDLVLNGSDVKSVTHLAPETGEALYGEKGANGVLIITLKNTEEDN